MYWPFARVYIPTCNQAIGEEYLSERSPQAQDLSKISPSKIAKLIPRKRELKEIVAQETTNTAFRQGMINRFEQHGHDLVRVSEHESSCELCAEFQGQTFSLSGQDPEFPPFSEAEEGGLFNVGCLHVLSLAPEEKDRFLDTLKGEYGEEARQAEIDRLAEEGGYVSPEEEAQFETTSEKIDAEIENSETLWNELSDEEQVSVYQHSDRDINSLMNNYLYNGAQIDDEIIEMCDHLDVTLQKASLADDMTLYRGVDADTWDILKSKSAYTTPGSIINLKGFTATSYDEDVALGYAKESASESDEVAMIEILAPKGTQAMALENHSHSPEDCEILINRNTKFKVLDSQKDGNVTWLCWEALNE